MVWAGCQEPGHSGAAGDTESGTGTGEDSASEGGSSTVADDGTGSSDSGDTEDIPEDAPSGVGKTGIRRLTQTEYDNVIADILRDESRPAATYLPEDQKTPFDNDLATQSASRVLVEGAEALAGEIAARLLADSPRRTAVIGCIPDDAQDAGCMDSFVRDFGRLALRRTLAETEVEEFTALGMDYAGQGQDFYVGVEQVLRAFLQDPEFLYRVEIGSPVLNDPGVFALSGSEVATRMSFLVWGSTPDVGLLDMAEAGELSDPQARRDAMALMLQDDRALRQVDRFHALWLGYDALPHTPELVYGMRTETQALIQRVIFEDGGSWLDLFTSTDTWVDDALASHYGLTLPAAGEGWVDYAGNGRQGILSHGAFLSVAANPGDTSPTKRGALIRTRLLCDEIPPPPPDAPADEPPSVESGECKVDQYAAHRESASCAACHDQMDPIGFGLENYDLAGRWRDHDDGAPQCEIEGSGELVGVGTFSGPAELSDLVIDNGIDACVAEHLYIYAMGHQITEDDEPYAEQLATNFVDADHRFDALLLDLVAHPAFGFRKEEDSP